MNTIDISDKVVYQVYPKSFKDSSGDGWGDLRGVTEKLDYLAELGVDYIWLTPFFPSPQRDNGYDVADYRAVDPRYGTMEDFEELSREAHARGIGIMLDMVLNHTSTEHEWFQRALAGEKRYQDYYYFREGTPDKLPTNWTSKFGGPTWEWALSVGKWYLHLFDPGQADLDWSNPEVRREVADVVRFWREKGVNGFRFDVVNLISKPEVFEDDFEGDGRRFYTDGPRVHEYLQELVREAGIDAADGFMTVGEMSSTSLDACLGYTRPSDHELSMVFSFHHLKVDYRDGKKWALMPADLGELQRLLSTWQEGMQAGGGWNALFWDNHDQPRVVSRFGDDGALRVESARMLCLFMNLLRGTPYVYQGNELGMTNAHFTSIEQYRDVESTNYFDILVGEGKTPAEALHIVGERSRDNARTPMQWDTSHAAGFSDGEPWATMACDVPGCDQSEICAELEVGDSDSIFSFYQRVIGLRHNMPVVAHGKVRFLDADAVPVLEYARFGELAVGETYDAARATPANMAAPGSLLVLANFSGAEAEVGAEARELLADGIWDVLLRSYDVDPAEGTLRPYEGVVYVRRQ